MASEYDISVVIKLLNKFSRPAKDISGTSLTMGKRIGEIGEWADLSGAKLLGLLGPIAKVTSVLAGTTLGIAAWSTKGAFELDTSLGRIETSLDGTAEFTDRRVQHMKRSFQDFAMDFPTSVAQMVEGARTGLREFGDIPDIIYRTIQATKSAFAGGGTVTEAMSVVGQVQNAYNDTSKETFDLLANLIPAAVHKSRAEFGAMSHAVGRAAPLFAKFGISIPEFLGSFAELTKVIGGRASIVGFQMASLMDALRKFKDVGPVIKMLEEEEPGKGWTNFLKILNLALKGDTTKLYKAFGSRGAAAMELLTRLKGIENIEEFIELAANVGSGLDYNAEAIKKLTEGSQDAVTQWLILKETAGTFQKTLGDTTKEFMKPWMDSANKGLIKLIIGMRHLQDASKMKVVSADKSKPRNWWEVTTEFWTNPKKIENFVRSLDFASPILREMGKFWKPVVSSAVKTIPKLDFITPLSQKLESTEWLKGEFHSLGEIAEMGKKKNLFTEYLGAGERWISTLEKSDLDKFQSVMEQALENAINNTRQKLFETSFVQNVGKPENTSSTQSINKSEITIKLQAEKGTSGTVYNVNNSDPNTSFQFETEIVTGAQ